MAATGPAPKALTEISLPPQYLPEEIGVETESGAQALSPWRLPH